MYGNTKYVNFSIKGGGLLGIHLPKITTLSLNNCVKCNFDILHTLSVCYTYFKWEKREERERERGVIKKTNIKGEYENISEGIGYEILTCEGEF